MLTTPTRRCTVNLKDIFHKHGLGPMDMFASEQRQTWLGNMSQPTARRIDKTSDIRRSSIGSFRSNLAQNNARNR